MTNPTENVEKEIPEKFLLKLIDHCHESGFKEKIKEKYSNNVDFLRPSVFANCPGTNARAKSHSRASAQDVRRRSFELAYKDKVSNTVNASF